MDLSFSPEELSFRDEMGAFIRDHLPASIRAKAGKSPHYDRADVLTWHKILDTRGWAASHWPPEYGGPGWSPVKRYIFMEEMLQAPAPEPLSFNINMVGPVVYTFGSPEQKQRFLPKIRGLDYWFCQGFSEPCAGSDLAALRTSAVRDVDDYLVNGQKIWTSTAHWADWMFCLVRTDPAAKKKQEGISFLLIDMKTPGVTVRPISTIDGHHHTNEVFLDDVRVPVANRIGEENKGWEIAKFLLGNERTGIARVGLSKGRLKRARALAQSAIGPKGPLSRDGGFRRRCLELEVELKALEVTALRIIDRQRRNDGIPDPASSILKLRGAETQQMSAELVAGVAGPLAAIDSRSAEAVPEEALEPFDAAIGAMTTYFFSRAASIYGGASEIQKNIIAKAILGL